MDAQLIAAAILLAAHHNDPSRTGEPDLEKIAEQVAELDDKLTVLYGGDLPTEKGIEDRPEGEAEINDGGAANGGEAGGVRAGVSDEVRRADSGGDQRDIS